MITPGPAKRMGAGIGGLLLLSAVIAYYSTSGTSSTRWSLATVRKGGFAVTVHSVGTLDTAGARVISSQIRGNMGKIIYMVEDGAWVEKGDILVKFDPSPFEEQIMSLTGQVKGYEAMLSAARQSLEWEKSQLEREIKKAQLELKTARLNLVKLKRGDGPIQLSQLKGEMEEKREKYLKFKNYAKELARLESEGFGGKAEIDRARLNVSQFEKLFKISQNKYKTYRDYVLPSLLESARTKVAQMEMETEQIKKGGVFRTGKALAVVEKAVQDLATAREKLDSERRELGKTVVRSPYKGIVTLYEAYRDNVKRKPRVGDTVWQNQPILYLPDITSFVVKTKIREIDLHKIKRGMTARVKVDAYPDLEFTGKISTIGALARRAPGASAHLGGEKYFRLIIALEGGDARLRPGMTARVTALADEVTDALIVPVPSVFSEGRRKYCWKHSSNRYEKAYIRMGRSNEDYVEILSGLKRGDVVSLAKPE